MPAPDTVVFDIGRVLIEWDPRHVYRQLFPGDEAGMEWFLREVCSDAWNAEQDFGRSWDDGIAEATQRHPRWESHIRCYRTRWHEMVPGTIEPTVALLQALAARSVPLYAITNFAADTFAEVVEHFRFFSLFKGVVVSGIERIIKPDPRIYQLLASRYGLMPEQCLFVDDKQQNVLSARAVGMQAHHFATPEGLHDDLVDLGLLAARP
jgi:2-haloacid dehalogenase